MQTLTDTEIISLLKSYRWNDLYDLVKNVNYDFSISIQKQILLALKAMMLSGWWSDNFESVKILNHFPPLLSDPLIHFAITYSYISLGDIKKMKYYLSHVPKNQPKWMNTWLNIEYLGRGLQDKKQILLLEKSIAKNKIEDYVKIALLQSLQHNHCNLSYRKEFLLSNAYLLSDDYLSIGLSLKTNIINYNNLSNNESSFLLSKYAFHLIEDLKFKDALATYDKIVQNNFFDMVILDKWLQLSMTLPQGKEYFFKRFDFALNSVPNNLMQKGTIGCYGIIFSWINGDYIKAYKIANELHQYINIINDNIKHYQIFYMYILSLCVVWQNNKNYYEFNKIMPHKELFIFGESHSLSLANFYFEWMGGIKKGISMFVMGIKMYHLSNPKKSLQSKFLQESIYYLKPQADILFTIGEIDTRPDEGIWQVHLKKEKNLDLIIDNTVGGYIEFLYENLKDKNLSSVTIQGIPAPAYALEGDKDPKDEAGFLNMIKQVNEKLKELTLEKEWNFLDVYTATVGEDGRSNKKWHLDGYHLQPIFYIEADKWLVKP